MKQIVLSIRRIWTKIVFWFAYFFRIEYKTANTTLLVAIIPAATIIGRLVAYLSLFLYYNLRYNIPVSYLKVDETILVSFFVGILVFLFFITTLNIPSFFLDKLQKKVFKTASKNKTIGSKFLKITLIAVVLVLDSCVLVCILFANNRLCFQQITVRQITATEEEIESQKKDILKGLEIKYKQIDDYHSRLTQFRTPYTSEYKKLEKELMQTEKLISDLEEQYKNLEDRLATVRIIAKDEAERPYIGFKARYGITNISDQTYAIIYNTADYVVLESVKIARISKQLNRIEIDTSHQQVIPFPIEYELMVFDIVRIK